MANYQERLRRPVKYSFGQAIGEAVQGAGKYFGELGIEKRKAENLALARAQKLEDRDELREYNEGRIPIDNANELAQLKAKGDLELEQEIAHKNAMVEHGFGETLEAGRAAELRASIAQQMAEVRAGLREKPGDERLLNSLARLENEEASIAIRLKAGVLETEGERRENDLTAIGDGIDVRIEKGVLETAEDRRANDSQATLDLEGDRVALGYAETPEEKRKQDRADYRFRANNDLNQYIKKSDVDRESHYLKLEDELDIGVRETVEETRNRNFNKEVELKRLLITEGLVNDPTGKGATALKESQQKAINYASVISAGLSRGFRVTGIVVNKDTGDIEFGPRTIDPATGEAKEFDFESWSAVMTDVVDPFIPDAVMRKMKDENSEEFDAAAGLISEGSLRAMTGAAAPETEVGRYAKMFTMARGMDPKVALRNIRTAIAFKTSLEKMATMGLTADESERFVVDTLRELEASQDRYSSGQGMGAQLTMSNEDNDLFAKYNITP